MSPTRRVRRALLSVSDKTGIVALARSLHELGIEILSTGGTWRLLSEQGIAAVEVSDYTGFPELLDGRVKTLHPKIHAGILARGEQDQATLQEHDIQPIDLVVVNLYPFEDTVAAPHCDLDRALENIDIGGPSMVRAAAKNNRFVAVLVNPGDYAGLAKRLQEQDGHLDQTFRFELAVKAIEHSAGYDGAIANYLGSRLPTAEKSGLPRTFNATFAQGRELRYGENPHQRAAFYPERKLLEPCIAGATQLQGKALSFNNIADADAALECVKSFRQPACVIVKHANPCGVAVAESPQQAYQLAFDGDPVSAYGGIIAFNRDLKAATARRILDRQFAELIIAPAVSDGALKVTSRSRNLRVLSCGQWGSERSAWLDYKRVNGGLLVQERDLHELGPKDFEVVSKRAPDQQQMRDLQFAWRVVNYVKSNAIVYCRDNRTIGIGAGQMSRVYSARLAAFKAADAGLEVKGSVMASDAFFPFRDGIDAAAEAGITAVIQPGGSIKDEEVVAAADEHDMAMVFTGVRHFRH